MGVSGRAAGGAFRAPHSFCSGQEGTHTSCNVSLLTQHSVVQLQWEQLMPAAEAQGAGPGQKPLVPSIQILPPWASFHERPLTPPSKAELTPLVIAPHLSDVLICLLVFTCFWFGATGLNPGSARRNHAWQVSGRPSPVVLRFELPESRVQALSLITSILRVAALLWIFLGN